MLKDTLDLGLLANAGGLSPHSRKRRRPADHRVLTPWILRLIATAVDTNQTLQYKHGTIIIYFRLLSAAGLAVPPAMSKLGAPANAKVLQLHADAMDLPLWTCRFVSLPMPWTIHLIADAANQPKPTNSLLRVNIPLRPSPLRKQHRRILPGSISKTDQRTFFKGATKWDS